MPRGVSRQSATGSAVSLLAAALGAAAFAAVAIGALAIGRLAVGRLTIKKARFNALEVDELTANCASSSRIRRLATARSPAAEAIGPALTDGSVVDHDDPAGSRGCTALWSDLSQAPAWSIARVVVR